MSLKWPKPGQLDVALYQVSSIPWVTQSMLGTVETQRQEFPRVTRFVTITNQAYDAAAELSVAFTENGLATAGYGDTKRSAYVKLLKGETKTMDVRCKELWLSNSQGDALYYGKKLPFEIIAGMTEIPDEMFPTLTGSSGGSMEGVG